MADSKAVLFHSEVSSYTTIYSSVFIFWLLLQFRPRAEMFLFHKRQKFRILPGVGLQTTKGISWDFHRASILIFAFVCFLEVLYFMESVYNFPDFRPVGINQLVVLGAGRALLDFVFQCSSFLNLVAKRIQKITVEHGCSEWNKRRFDESNF